MLLLTLSAAVHCFPAARTFLECMRVIVRSSAGPAHAAGNQKKRRFALNRWDSRHDVVLRVRSKRVRYLWAEGITCQWQLLDTKFGWKRKGLRFDWLLKSHHEVSWRATRAHSSLTWRWKSIKYTVRADPRFPFQFGTGTDIMRVEWNLDAVSLEQLELLAYSRKC